MGWGWGIAMGIMAFLYWSVGALWLFVLLCVGVVGVVVLYGLAVAYFELRDEFLRDQAKFQALRPALDKGTLRGFVERRAQQILDREEEIRARTDEALYPGSSIKLFFYRRWGGEQAINYLLADLYQLAWAKRYIAQGGDYRDKRRAELEAAKLLKLRKQLAQRYGLSPFQQQALGRRLEDLIELRREDEDNDYYRGGAQRHGYQPRLPKGQRRRRRR